jgi:predicted Zn-dependent protease
MSALGRIRAMFSPRRLLPVCALLAAAGLAGAFAYRRVEAQHHWKAARAALEAQDVEAARGHLGACARYWPADPEVRFWAAVAARRCAAYEEAEEHLTACELLQAKARNPNIAPGFERLLLRAQLGQTRELGRRVGDLERSGDERLPPALEALAVGSFEAMHYEEAMIAAGMLLEKSPGHVGGLLLQGRLFRHFGKHESALECYEQVLARLPEARTPKLRLAECLVSLGRLAEAAQGDEALRRQTPDDPEVLFRLARCRADLARRDEARALLDRLLARQPDHAEALLERGRLEYHHDSPAEAEVFLRRAVAAAPRRAEPLVALAACLEAEGRQTEAEESRAAAERFEVEHARLARQMAHVTHHPEDAEGAEAVADELLRLGEEDEALRWYAAALWQDPARAGVHRALAEYFEKHGQPHRSAYHRRQIGRGG